MRIHSLRLLSCQFSSGGPRDGRTEGRSRSGLNYMRSPAVNHTSPRQPAFTPSPRQHQCGPIPSTHTHTRPTGQHRKTLSVQAFSCTRAAMVKLGSNLSDKLEKQPSADDGFDNIPLITPLEVSQLQQPFAEKVIVKTSTQYQLQQQKKNKLYVPSIKKLNINFYSDVSDKAKITGLIFITLAFLTSLLLLLMYKAMWYDQLTCPEGFILKQKHCTPAALEMYYTEQQQQQEPGFHGSANRGLYAALSHLSQVKRTGPELPPPWLPVITAMKEAELAKQGSEPLKGAPEGEE
ncbi:calcyon neuron-specific vesicular protein isoform X1 [Acanthopagrus latus]|uniref:calcyon neuron-specific vesicular protein isoform X1 n=2 Tax=Acanthopagrus latus TaxID=8177 RepID=UPI00187BCA60|nr:calcyon neuron-specific vesicular protein isoform X1 [Acanthopagrus latus]